LTRRKADAKQPQEVCPAVALAKADNNDIISRKSDGFFYVLASHPANSGWIGKRKTTAKLAGKSVTPE